MKNASNALNGFDNAKKIEKAGGPKLSTDEVALLSMYFQGFSFEVPP